MCYYSNDICARCIHHKMGLTNGGKETCAAESYPGEFLNAAALCIFGSCRKFEARPTRTVLDLNREQLEHLKTQYLFDLADEGTFAEVLGVDYDEPSYNDIANADEIVPDDVIFRQWEGTSFVPEDFGQESWD